MEELLTLDCKSIVRRLLRNQPHLAAWTDICEIYIDKFDNHFSTCLIIDCRFKALASFFTLNSKTLFEQMVDAMPIPVRIIHENNLIIAYLPLLELSPANKATGLIMVTTLQQAQQSQSQIVVEPSIGMGQIPSSMQDLIREQVASLNLPVYLDTKGGSYKLPQTSFEIAWKEIGNAVWRQEFGAIDEPPPVTDNGTKAVAKPSTPTKPAEKRASTKSESPRALLMREKLTPDDIVTTGRNGAKLTLDNFLGKVSTKHLNREQVLESIINQNEHGLKLLEKLFDAYSRKDGIYKVRPQEWAKTKAKIIDECRKILNPPQEQVPETEAQQEAETTAE